MCRILSVIFYPYKNKIKNISSNAFAAVTYFRIKGVLQLNFFFERL